MIWRLHKFCTFILISNYIMFLKWIKWIVLLIKVDVLIKYSNKKRNIAKIKLIWTLKISTKNWREPFFESPKSKGLTSCQKILWECSFKRRNLLNFTFLAMKFHNHYHTSLQPNSTEYLIFLHWSLQELQVCKNSHNHLDSFFFKFFL